MTTRGLKSEGNAIERQDDTRTADPLFKLKKSGVGILSPVNSVARLFYDGAMDLESCCPGLLVGSSSFGLQALACPRYDALLPSNFANCLWIQRHLILQQRSPQAGATTSR